MGLYFIEEKNGLQLPLFYDQEAPENIKNLTIYRSSAGSGKTFTLVKDYLKLVLRDPENYRKILAITFTNKASEEMKHRILDELSAISVDRHTDLRKAIEGEFKEEEINLQITQRAATALNNILHNYGRFGVSTLDHFFAQVVRGFARELDLPLQYELDVDEVSAIEYAVDKLYEQLGEDESLKKWLEDFAFSKMENDKGWDIDRNLKELGKALFGENFRKGIGKRQVGLDEFREFVDQLQAEKKGFEQGLQAYARQALKLIEAHGLSFTDFSYGYSSFANTFNKILEFEFSLNARFISCMEGNQSWHSKTSTKIAAINEVKENGLQEIGQKIILFREENLRSYHTASNLLKNIYSYGILGYIDDELKSYREEKNILLLSDHAFLLNEVIDQNDAPIIYEKVGARFKHILIDEFQDTSLFQWKNILPLAQNVLSNYGDVLIVGDVKQSIYRWRGGDMTLLIAGIQKDLVQYREQTVEKQLDTNYRSASNIVTFNNHFFRTAVSLLEVSPDLPETKLLQDTYTHLEQKVYFNKEGVVQVRFFPNEEDNDWKEQSKEQVLSIIRKQLANGYTPADFLILVDRWDLGYEIADHLILNDFKVITDKSLKVMNNQVVQLLVNAIKWLHDNDDRLAKTNLLFIYLQLQHTNRYEYHEIFTDVHNEDRVFAAEMPPFFLSNLKVFLRLPLYELVEGLIETFGIEKQLNNFVLRFQEICLEQSSKGNNDLHTFLSWWEESKDDLVVITPENDEAIEIMTVHKAKGLQKPIVIIPFASYDLGTMSNSLFWTSKLPEEFRKFNILPLVYEGSLAESNLEEAYREEQLEGVLERLNMSYVAFTRAEQQLYIFAEGFKSTPKDNRKINKLMYRVFDDNSFHLKDKWSLDEGCFSWGTTEMKPWKKKESRMVEELKVIPKSRPQHLSIRSESNRFFLLFDNEKSSKIKQGLLMHYLFEQMQHAEVDKVVAEMVADGLISDDQAPALEQMAGKLLEKPQVKAWFEQGLEVLSERSIVTPEGGLRPDRVVINGGAATVVDYKTGEKKPENVQQVKRYMSVLTEMGYHPVEGYLLYFTNEEIVKVE